MVSEETGSTGADSSTNGADATGRPPTTKTLHLAYIPDELRESARSGGPPKDGIPAIEEPSFVTADAAEHLDDDNIVFGLERNGVAKAYPRKILVHHEICNDEIGGHPISVTYCPLTGTAMGFERGGTTFGVSGRLINNNLVMYDRETEAWWPQIPATSIPGPWNEEPGTNSLQEFRVIWTTWKLWRAYRTDTTVLSEETGFIRSYGRDPYGSYYSNKSTLFPRLNPDDSFHTKRTFIGVRTTEGASAFLKDSLREKGSMSGTLGGEELIAVYDTRLDTAYVYRNPDRATVTVDGDQVTVASSSYEPDSLPLERLYAFDAMWFAWIGFYPESNVYA